MPVVQKQLYLLLSAWSKGLKCTEKACKILRKGSLRRQCYTVNREIFVFKNLRVINFRVKKSSSASGSDEDFLTTKFF